MTLAYLFNGPDTASATVLLAHGAGGAMDSPSMTAAAEALAATDLRVARFEFNYMAARRTGGRKPPPKADTLLEEYRSAIDQLEGSGKLIIGGKSMGGRVASMIAAEAHAARRISGLLCLGYPFHPPNQPQQRRTGHLLHLTVPTLIVQGTRDPFGTPEDVAQYELPPAIEFIWLEDGDHDLKPRKRVSGLSHHDHLTTMAAAVRRWVDGLAS